MELNFERIKLLRFIVQKISRNGWKFGSRVTYLRTCVRVTQAKFCKRLQLNLRASSTAVYLSNYLHLIFLTEFFQAPYFIRARGFFFSLIGDKLVLRNGLSLTVTTSARTARPDESRSRNLAKFALNVTFYRKYRAGREIKLSLRRWRIVWTASSLTRTFPIERIPQIWHLRFFFCIFHPFQRFALPYW